MEIVWDREQIEESVRMISDKIEVVEDSDFESHRALLYQLAQMQADIC